MKFKKSLYLAAALLPLALTSCDSSDNGVEVTKEQWETVFSAETFENYTAVAYSSSEQSISIAGVNQPTQATKGTQTIKVDGNEFEANLELETPLPLDSSTTADKITYSARYNAENALILSVTAYLDEKEVLTQSNDITSSSVTGYLFDYEMYAPYYDILSYDKGAYSCNLSGNDIAEIPEIKDMLDSLVGTATVDLSGLNLSLKTVISEDMKPASIDQNVTGTIEVSTMGITATLSINSVSSTTFSNFGTTVLED